ncbi:MAG: hypothetical protein WC054_06020 [Candidatus Nanopelagicales bacterium]
MTKPLGVTRRAVQQASTVGVTVILGATSVPHIAASPVAATVDQAGQTSKVPAPRAFIVGDSLTVGIKSQLSSKLRRHVRSVHIDARVSRYTAEGIRRLRSNTARRANIWVVALGTNDAANTLATRRNVSKVMRMAGPKRHVIWINVVRPGGYHRVNRTFATLDRRHNRLSVVDWAGMVRGRSGLLAGDRVHLTPRGNRLRTIATCDAIKAVSRPSPT